MELELFENFQNDIHELNTFKEFINLEGIVKRIETGRHIKSLRGYRKMKPKRFNPLLNLKESNFRRYYRFSKDNMKRLVEMLKDDLEIEQQIDEKKETKNKNQVPIENQIMAALRYWGGTEHPEMTARVHGVTFKTLQKIVKRVAEALAYKASRYIRMPCLLVEKQKVTKSFYDLAHMPQVIGAVLYTNVKCKRSNGDTQTKPDDILHIQIVTDADFKIRDLDFRLKPASATNFTAANLFAQTRIKERFEQNEFRGRLLLGDASMKCSSSLYTPVKCPFTLAEQAFNNAQRLTYEPARICLKRWRQRFGILHKEWYGSASTNRHVIVALVLLHNMAIEWSDPALDDDNTFNNCCRPTAIDDYKTIDEHGRSEFINKHFYSSLFCKE